MSWHYQIQEFEDILGKFYQIVEVYSCGAQTEDGITPMGKTPEELFRELERMLKDAKKYPVLPLLPHKD